MRTPREQHSLGRRPRLSVVTSEPPPRRSGFGRERGPRLAAHPLQFDERGLPIAQPPLSAAERVGRPLPG
jgi:hypothetical protein